MPGLSKLATFISGMTSVLGRTSTRYSGPGSLELVSSQNS